ncbi:MAG: polysaccharide deacetylase family protein [Bacteroidetes bacterium]|nr:polysaccharide deacetylase family protein [Bacteroidota bacterium]
MKINIIISCDYRIRNKIQYGFTLLLHPWRVEFQFTPTIAPDCVNIFYGRQRPSTPKKAFWFAASQEFLTRITEKSLPDVSNAGWIEFSNRKLPKLFPLPPIEAGPAIDFDIIAATFILASNYQDLISLERDEFDRLRAMDSLQDKLGVLEIPVVNYYSRFLRQRLEESSGTLIEEKKYGEAECGLALSHDIDYTSSLNYRMIRRNIIGHGLINREHLYPQERLRKLGYPLLALFGYDPPREGMLFLRNIEKSSNLRSTFFIKSGATSKEDVAYDFNSGRMREYIKSLSDSGFEIGIHPSMTTYIDSEKFIGEKSRLEDALGRRISSVRQHYLKFTAGKTVGIWENAGLQYDSTLGFSRKVGFRNSVAFPFPLYNFAEDRVSSVIEVPLMIMDGTVVDSGRFETGRALDKMTTLVEEVKKSGGAASILFHNSIADPIDFPGYKVIYSKILDAAKSNGFFVGSVKAVAEHFN